jgi:acyl-coenzyme A synthetase/AMP-(fatty) acid ligase
MSDTPRFGQEPGPSFRGAHVGDGTVLEAWGLSTTLSALLTLLGIDTDPQLGALVLGGVVTTRGELAALAGSLAEEIALRVRPGHRVGLVDGGGVWDVALVLGALRAGRSVAMLPVRGPDDTGLDGLAAEARCDLVAVGGVLRSADPGPADPADPFDARYGAELGGSPEAVLLYTSGTTSRPRGVRLSAANIAANLTAMLRSTEAWTPADRLGQVLALTHSFGLSMMFLALARRVPVVLAGGGPPTRGLMATLDEQDVSLFACVPYFLRLAAKRGLALGRDGARRLRVLYLAGGGIRDDELDEVLPGYTGTTYLMYGFTEGTARIAVRRRGDGSPADSVGLPLPGTHVDIVDELGAPLPLGEVGRIRATSPSLMIGYLGLPPRDPGAPHTTTDLGRLGPGGDLFITGREAEMHNFRGNRVSLVALESRVADVPGVLEARVQPDRAEEDSPCVLRLVLAAGADPGAVRLAALAAVEPRGLIREVLVVDRLETTRSGKAIRRPLQEPVTS